MTPNKLAVNSNKTEYLLFNPNYINLSLNTINLGSNISFPSDSAKKNICVIFQTDMSIYKTAHLLLANIMLSSTP